MADNYLLPINATIHLSVGTKNIYQLASSIATADPSLIVLVHMRFPNDPVARLADVSVCIEPHLYLLTGQDWMKCPTLADLFVPENKKYINPLSAHGNDNFGVILSSPQLPFTDTFRIWNTGLSEL